MFQIYAFYTLRPNTVNFNGIWENNKQISTGKVYAHINLSSVVVNSQKSHIKFVNNIKYV